MRSALLPACSLASLGIVAAVAGTGCEGGAREVISGDKDVVIAENAPPSLSGGTLIVSADQERAVAADPDRDLVWVVDLASRQLARKITLLAGDEPGRLVEDAAGRVHVALRNAGALVTFDPESGEILRRAPVCVAPRGLAFDAAKGHVHVACADGQLVTVDAASGAEVRRLALDHDLRDVVVQGDRLIVSRFRSAELLSIDAAGVIAGRAVPPTAELFPSSFGGGGAGGAGTGDLDHFAPTVAWRMVPRPEGGALVVHQRSKVEEIITEEPGGYGGDGCGSIVHGALTRVDVADDGTVLPPTQALTRFPAVLPLDLAFSADGASVAVAVAGSQNVLIAGSFDLDLPADQSCGLAGYFVEGTPVAVAFQGNQAIAQTREPPALVLVADGTRIELPGESVRDTGHDLFHLPPGMVVSSDSSMGGTTGGGVAEPSFGIGSLACASCHPEGGDDAHVWTFQGIGARRTQSLRGDVLATLPLHWDGDMENVSAIMDEVFMRRMGGPQAGPVMEKAIEHWIGEIPAPTPMRSPEDPAALRGKAIFESDAVGCAQCHSGPALTNNQNAAVGKGKALQVPSLVGIAWRAPFMHDGCAKTLADRFDPTCGGTEHGDVSGLSADDLSDLVAYLESL